MKKYKLLNINNQSNKNDDNLKKQELQQNQIHQDIVIDKVPYHFFDKVINIETEWEDFEPGELYGEETFIYNMFKVYKHEFPVFDIRLLPFLNIKILYRNKNTESQQNFIFYPSISHTFQLEDIENETDDNFKKVILTASLHLRISNTSIISFYKLYESKMLISFINPRQYK